MARDRLETLSETLRSAFGLAALVGCFVLTSPGVRVVRADGPSPAPASAPAEGRLEVVVEEVDGRVESAPRMPDPTAEAAEDVVVLNTRGYNYGPDRPIARPRLASPPAAPASPPAAPASESDAP